MVAIGLAAGSALALQGAGISMSLGPATTIGMSMPTPTQAAVGGGAIGLLEGVFSKDSAKDTAHKAGRGATVAGTLKCIANGCWKVAVVGAKYEASSDNITYDCWKKVVRNTSEKPSSGMLLKDLLAHPFVAGYKIAEENGSDLPYIVIENIWKERFEIQYFYLRDSRQIVCHANPLTFA